MKSKCAFALASILLSLASGAYAQPSYTAHEWGTFTSVQGGDGKLLWWGPFAATELPAFVHSWLNPGMDRPPVSDLGKGNLTALQRLETPVIYFYSDAAMNVDVSVDFPKGTITEWYPQTTASGQNGATWSHLAIRPSSSGESFVHDGSGSHYFSARETASDSVEMNFQELAQPKTESDKFVFYRGTGSFKTPLLVTVNEDSGVSVANTGTEKLAHLLLVSIHDGKGAFNVLPELAAGQSNAWLNLNSLNSDLGQLPVEAWPSDPCLDSGWPRQPLAQFQAEIGRHMEFALVSEGLFPDEAKAMVKTWTDSWFTEEGERVLYILPRPWTDEILPITLTPQPKTLVRVMVGRAEIITPALEKDLARLLAAGQSGNTQAQQATAAQLHKLGRFAGPALQLAANRQGASSLAAYGSQLLVGPPPKTP